MRLQKQLESLLQKMNIATLAELSEATGYAEGTVKKTLAELDYLTSYNQNSRFYALRSSCSFDKYGIWKHKKASFTHHGNLPDLVVNIVDNSKAGFTATELEVITGTTLKTGVLQRLAKNEKLIRVRIKCEYFYFSAVDKRRRESQARKRFGRLTPLDHQEKDKSTEELKKTIIVLLEVIRGQPRSIKQLQLALQKTNPEISAEMVTDVCRQYNIDLKKKCYRHEIFDIAVKVSHIIRERTGKLYVFCFRPEKLWCQVCGDPVKYYRITETRTIQTLRYGAVCFQEILFNCPEHLVHPENGTSLIHRSSFVSTLAPIGATIGYDVIVEIGKARFCEFRQVKKVVTSLKNQQISISTSSVSRWTDYFLAAIECLHNTKIHKLKRLIKNNGGYLLHVDATTETKSDTVFVCIDRILGTVLLSEKISSENAEEIKHILRRLKHDLGSPLAIMKDMGNAIDGAIQKVFPHVPSRICQFHFLKDIGKDLLGPLHLKVGKDLTALKINQDLRRMKRELEKTLSVEMVQAASTIFKHLSKIEQASPRVVRKHEAAFTLSLIDWILKYANDEEGFGFPFDLSWLCYYSRLNRVRLRLGRYISRQPRALHDCPHLKKIETIINRITYKSLRSNVRQLRSVYQSFQQLRSILKFEITEKSPLATTLSIGTSKEVRAYNKGVLNHTKKLLAEKKRGELNEIDKIVLKHFETYQFKLLIPVELVEILEDLDRTNNFEESMFRDLKRGQRRQVGKKNIWREFSFHGPYLPLMQNLTNEHYVSVVIGNADDLPIRISELDPNDIEYYCRKLYESRRGKFFDCLPQIQAVDLLPHQ
jgi:hypothetical protein